MLVMSKGALTAAKAETYYQEKYSHDDYYSEKQQVVGQWFGRGAEELGLSGEIETEDFRAVLRGLRPASREVLVHKANGYDDRRAGWDATFNAPKSVSIQGLVGDDRRLIEAHRKAVSHALVELEQYALSRRRGGSEWVVTGNVVAARFDHIAARPAGSAVLVVQPGVEHDVAIFVGQGRAQSIVTMPLLPQFPRDCYQRLSASLELGETKDLVNVIGYIRRQVEVSGVTFDQHRDRLGRHRDPALIAFSLI